MAKKKTSESEAAGPSFEEALGRLEQIVHLLEEGEIGLAEALARYEEGVRLLRQSYDLLEHAERRIELLSGVDADGQPIVQPLDDAADASLGEKAKRRSRRRSATGKTGQNENNAGTDMDAQGGLF